MNIQKQITKFIYGITYLYLLSPFLLFALGWMKISICVPICIVLIVCFISAVQNTSLTNVIEISKFDISKIAVITLIICIWVYLSGIGRFVFQNSDHYTRNAIFEILVQYDWPIINNNVLNTLPGNPTRTSLIYYIGFWLPAAVIGKVFGIQAGYYFQYFWATLGILLVYYYVCVWNKKIVIWPLFILIFFSGLDVVGVWFKGENIIQLANTTHIEWWAKPYQYSSMTTQLFWVFNQALPAWLITIFIYLQNNNKYIVLILACALLTSTFPFVGLIPIAIWVIIRNFKKNNSINGFLSYQNFLGGGIVGILSFLYLKSNIATRQVNNPLVPAEENSLIKYIFFIFFEVGVYIILLYKYQNKNSIYYLITCLLCLIPLFKIGRGGDFCMRVSIPALFLLMLLIIDTIQQAYKSKDLFIFKVLIIVLCIGAITPLHEISRTFSNTIISIDNGEHPYAGSRNYIEILNTDYLSGGINNSIFYKYITK